MLSLMEPEEDQPCARRSLKNLSLFEREAERLKRKRLSYQRNAERERLKALARFYRRKESATAEDIEKQRESHRQAQARYREKKRTILMTKAWEYRVSKKRQEEINNDEEEFQRLMAQEHEL